VFTRVLGVTAKQYVIRPAPARRPPARPGNPADPEIALEVGFGDLSNFVRRASSAEPRAELAWPPVAATTASPACAPTARRPTTPRS
jgi:AraC-like DNA-binding protein